MAEVPVPVPPMMPGMRDRHKNVHNKKINELLALFLFGSNGIPQIGSGFFVSIWEIDY
jgi:hypothetical protein